jgi:hypothetical protein
MRNTVAVLGNYQAMRLDARMEASGALQVLPVGWGVAVGEPGMGWGGGRGEAIGSFESFDGKLVKGTGAEWLGRLLKSAHDFILATGEGPGEGWAESCTVYGAEWLGASGTGGDGGEGLGDLSAVPKGLKKRRGEQG